MSDLKLVPVHAPPCVKLTPGLAEILNRGDLCKRIASTADDFEIVLAQLQRDHTTEENRDTAGPTLLALRMVAETMILVKARGQAQDQLERKAAEKFPK
jgi:hypothetical protein